MRTAADILVGHIMPTLQNSFVHAKNAAFRCVETDVDKIYRESVDFRVPHCFESPWLASVVSTAKLTRLAR
jgi:hypothetical protein